jgi:malate dehydrogenase (quinone)
MLKEIEPDWNIHVYERLDRPAIESSNERNNSWVLDATAFH